MNLAKKLNIPLFVAPQSFEYNLAIPIVSFQPLRASKWFHLCFKNKYNSKRFLYCSKNVFLNSFTNFITFKIIKKDIILHYEFFYYLGRFIFVLKNFLSSGDY